MEQLCGHCGKYYQHYICSDGEYRPIHCGHCTRDALRPYQKRTAFEKEGCGEWEPRNELHYEFGFRREKWYNACMEPLLKHCRLCPRACGVDRTAGEKGICGAGVEPRVARAALHFWEEPCISGESGSGTVFFSHCPLGCVYCQNAEISGGQAGVEITTERLGEIFLELAEQGAANINLVTPTHYAPQITEALRAAKEKGLTLPVVYNCGGYESVHVLRLLAGLVDIYLTDFKYMDQGLAQRYSHAADYPLAAKLALAEMVRQAGEAQFDEKGMMQKGVIVRHLLLPGQAADSRAAIRYLYETYGNRIYLSLMSQYTPVDALQLPEELQAKVTGEEYEELLDYALSLGVENGFIQEGEAADESFIPPFDLAGVREKQK